MNQFFKKKGPFLLRDILDFLSVRSTNLKNKNKKIYDIKSLDKATSQDITFLNSINYKIYSKKTKAAACITKKNLTKYLPNNCYAITTNDIQLCLGKLTNKFYPYSDQDYPDKNLDLPNNIKKKFDKVIFGNNVLIGKNVNIGKNTYIGSNSIIESNVRIGNNCVIGSFVNIKNTLMSNDVHIRDGSKIGVRGFGFVSQKNKNFKIPHIGKVILKNGVEIGSNCTIDRGSLSDTVIEENTFLDNQVHVAHNVKIGKNCIIAGQVGFAGSSVLGNDVVIGGQAGISGHIKIGNNVKIGGGSGVIRNIPDNSRVMGYPSVDLKKFVKQLES